MTKLRTIIYQHLKTIILLVSMILTTAVQADNEAAQLGNEGAKGGHGVLIDNKMYLLDLVEAGVEQDPYIKPEAYKDPAFPQVEQRLRQVFPRHPLLGDAETIAALSAKLIEIYHTSNALGLTLLAAIETLRWYEVNEELVKVWVHRPNLNLREIQLAIRRDLSVRVDKDLVIQMPAGVQRAALVLHETLSALVRPTQVEVRAGQILKKQDDSIAREFVGFLFSQDATNWYKLYRFNNGAFPAYKLAAELGEGFFQTYFYTTLEFKYAGDGGEGCLEHFRYWTPMNRADTANGFAERACPKVADDLYKRCSPTSLYFTGSGALNPYKFMDAQGRESIYLGVPREEFIQRDRTDFNPDKRRYMDPRIHSRQECLDFNRTVFNQAAPYIARPSVFLKK